MGRINALPERTGEQIVDANNFWFGIDVISEDKTVKISGQEMTELIGGGVTNITFTPTPGDPDEVTIDIGGTTAVVPLADDTPGSETAGFMTAGEKAELDLVSDLRTTFSVLSGTTSVRIGTFGVTGGDIPLTEVYISPATITTAGVMTSGDKVILNTLATGAQAIRTGDAIEVRFNYAPAQDAIFPDVDWQGAGPMPQLGGAWMALANEPFGPPDAASEYLWGFNYTASPTTGSVQAFKFDYEFLTGVHGLTAADIGKPLLWNGTAVSVYNDASGDWPTGILKYTSGTTRVAFARPGDILTIPIAQLDPGYSYPADGRFMFWDRSMGTGGQWVATKPGDSLDILPDMLEVMGVTAGVSFLGRVTEFGPAAVTGVAPPSGGTEEIALAASDPVNPPGADEKLGINSSTATVFTPVGGSWTQLAVDRNAGIVTHAPVIATLAVDLSTGAMNRRITLSTNLTVSFSANPVNPSWIVWEIANTGNFDITWPGTVQRQESIRIVRGSGQRTVITMFWDGTNYTVQTSRKDGVHSLGIVGSPLAVNMNDSPYDTIFGLMSGTVDVAAITLSSPTGTGRVGEITLMLQQPGGGGADINFIGSAFLGRPPATRKGPNEITVFKLLHDGTDASSYWHFVTENPSQPIATSTQLGDQTPDVTNMSFVVIDGLAGNITSLVGGVNGQRVTLMANDTVTIVHTGGQLTNQSGGNLTLNSGQTATYIRQGSNLWRQA